MTGKYSDGPSPSDEWFKQGKMVIVDLPISLFFLIAVKGGLSDDIQ